MKPAEGKTRAPISRDHTASNSLLTLLRNGLTASFVVVLTTYFIKNQVFVLFKTDPGLFPETYGLPLAFRETWIFVDTSGVRYYWQFFLLDVFIIFSFLVLMLYLLSWGRKFKSENA